MPESGMDSRAYIVAAAELLGIDLAPAELEAIARNFNNFKDLAGTVAESGADEPLDPAGIFRP